MDRRSNAAYTARAAARGSWQIRRFDLGQEPGDDLSAWTTGAERIGMMWPLARDAWSFAGCSIPDYPREETPIRVIRPAQARER